MQGGNNHTAKAHWREAMIRLQHKRYDINENLYIMIGVFIYTESMIVGVDRQPFIRTFCPFFSQCRMCPTDCWPSVTQISRCPFWEMLLTGRGIFGARSNINDEVNSQNGLSGTNACHLTYISIEIAFRESSPLFNLELRYFDLLPPLYRCKG